MPSLDPLAAGTLPRPGWIGRLVRLVLGMLLLWGTYRLLLAGMANPPGTVAPTFGFGVSVLLAFYGGYLLAAQYLPFVRPKQATAGLVALSGALVVVDRIVYQTWWAPPAAWFLFVMTVAILGFIGFSFLLAALFAVPG